MSLVQHLPALPVLLPAVTAVLLLLLGDGGATAQGELSDHRRHWARRIALASTLLGALFAFRLVELADTGVLTVYRMGDWPAPFGIVLVIDRLSALMVALTSAVALPVLWYACGGWDARGRHFHALFQFQLMGLNGAFVTGDIFNLFVFFEVLLIASYVLMMHGLGRERLRAGVHYVVLNLAASALFLVGVALIYALTGTLNLADLALRVPMVDGPESAVLQAAALILLVVFGFKAAMVPLAMWLPATYAAASAPVAALFAIMTKVGVYAIVRVHGVVFGADAGAAAFTVQPLLLPLGLATSVVGVLGALAAHTLPRLIAWLTVASVGTILAAIGLFDAAAWAAAMYYLVNSTLVIAGLFLLAELVAAQRGPMSDRLEPCSPVAQPALLGLLLLLAAASTAGLPPLPGFIGKLMLLEASLVHPWVVTVWTVVLGVGFLTLIGLARAGSILFWHVRPEVPGGASGASGPLLGATVALLAMSVMLSVWAAPVQRYTAAAAAQLADRAAYAAAVLPEQGGAAAQTTRPYRIPQPPAPTATTTGGAR
jgi:multicomponent K+:H+ antiporter subunit D